MKKIFNHTDEELIRLIQSDDLAAFEILYNRHSENLLYFLNSKLTDLEESKDLLQEIFVHIWSDRKHILDLQSVSGYLYRIAFNKSLNQLRRGKIEAEYIKSLAAFLQSEQHTAREEIDEAEQEKILITALSKLPEKMKAVFELRYFQGMSNQEVAEQLKLSPHTVATQMKRALKTIRKSTSLLLFISVLFKL